MKAFSRTDRSVLGRWWWTVDHGMLAALFTLIVFGVALVTAASPPVAERIGVGQYHFVIRHILFLIPSVFLMIGVSMLEPRWIWRVASVVLVAGLVLMVVVLTGGSEIKGAQRWISVFGFSLQPSEFVKPAFIVVAGWLIAWQKEKPDMRIYSLVCAGVYGTVVTLLLLQPDFGMTVVVTTVLAAQIFLAGLPFRYMVLFGVLGMLLIVAAYFSFDHVQSRIDRFLNPSSGDNYQVHKSLEAFQSGGLFGTGPGQGTVKMTIPDAHSDFVFAVGAEELGYVFTLVLLGVYGFILLRGFRRLADHERLFAVLAAGGLLVMFGLQAFIHMGSNLSLLPAKGMTLPFISYGGSSLMASAFTMGMVLALTRRQKRSGIARGGLLARTRAGGRSKA